MSKKKVVIWDLDNTIWNGILSENMQVTLKDGISGIIEELDNRGILQSIASKNNYEDAWQKLKEFHLDHYFIYPMINWNAKSINIKKIVEAINVSMDTVAFIDDQSFERDEVSFGIPEISCIDAAEIDTLLEREDIIPLYITEDSKIRRTLYQNDIVRNNMEEQFQGTQEEFLESLNMVMTVEQAGESDLQRAEELTVRTHQLNSTGYTYSYEKLKAFIDDENYELLIISLNDRYGYYGKIGLVLIAREEKQWTLKLLLTSCRVMSRGVGTAILGWLVNRAIDNEVILKAEFVPTDRNRIMSITYAMTGFHIDSKDSEKQTLKYNRNTRISLPRYIVIEERMD